MPKDNPNTERYIAIARACLKAINDTAADSGSREDKIQAVYQAIDKAFQAEFADYRQSVAIMATVLEPSEMPSGVLPQAPGLRPPRQALWPAVVRTASRRRGRGGLPPTACAGHVDAHHGG